MGKDRFHSAQVIDCGGLKVKGVQVINPNGVVTADIQATPGSISSTELADNTIKTATVTLTKTEIVGTSAGDIGSTGGAVLVAAPGAGKVLEFVSAVLSYDYDTAAYTGGASTPGDLTMRQGTTSVTGVIKDADLMLATADKIVQVSPLAVNDIPVTANSTINLKGTAYTDPGTAAGTLKVHVMYRVHSI